MIVHFLLMFELALRIVTPFATQGTTLEKDGDANAGAIVNGIALYIKY
jgi:hypothetical protein